MDVKSTLRIAFLLIGRQIAAEFLSQAVCKRLEREDIPDDSWMSESHEYPFHTIVAQAMCDALFDIQSTSHD